MSLVKLDWRERKALDQLSKQTSDATTLRRAQALLWLDRGERVGDVAERLGVSRQVIYQWIEIFRSSSRFRKLGIRCMVSECRVTIRKNKRKSRLMR